MPTSRNFHLFDSISQRPSAVVSTSTATQGSHATILRPREHTPSETLSAFANFMINSEEEETWIDRVKFMFRILFFCLGPGNIWRFPEQAVTNGQAVFFYLYTIYTWMLCLTALIFEISLSQYFLKGFGRLFARYSIMEGITLSITLYGLIAHLIYSLIAVYSIIYFFSGLHVHGISHSDCSQQIQNVKCLDDYSNFTFSPQRQYFFNFVERAADMFGQKYNWRNGLLLVVLYIILYLLIIFQIPKYRWIPVILSCAIFLILVIVATLGSCIVSGASKGVISFFLHPNLNHLSHIKVWIISVEQSIVSLGLGTGPLTTIWTNSKLKNWHYRDCFLVHCIVFVSSILSGLVFFSGAGVAAEKYNITIDQVFHNDRNFNTFTFVTLLCDHLGAGLGEISILLYYMVLMIGCCSYLTEYLYIFSLYVHTYFPVKSFGKKKLMLIFCISLCVYSSSLGIGYPLLVALNETFVGTTPLIILSCELICMLWFYGTDNFCDDIEFVLGYAPNYFFQVSWIVLPGVFTMFALVSLYLKVEGIKNKYDWTAFFLTLSVTILPLIMVAAYRFYGKNLPAQDTSRTHSLSRWDRTMSETTLQSEIDSILNWRPASQLHHRMQNASTVNYLKAM